MTTISDIEAETDTLNEVEDILDLPPVQFVSTGSDTRDRAIKGIFADAPRLIKDANAAGKWDAICASTNPGGEAEKFAIANSGITIADDEVVAILRKVKGFLFGVNLTVLQAYNKNCLLDQIKRLKPFDVVVDAAVVTPVETPVVEATVPQEVVSVVTPVETPVVAQVSVNGNVLTNSDGDTYELGQRGRRPQWVIDYLSTHAVEKKVPTLSGHVLTNVDGTTYEFGKRGRRPQWVIDWVTHNPTQVPA